MASDAAVEGLSGQEENAFRGYVNDAMGLLREGNYEAAEALLKQKDPAPMGRDPFF